MKDRKNIVLQLTEKRTELLDRLNRVQKSKSKVHDRDFSEQATERENDEVVDSLEDSILLEIEQINRALSRLESNTYDICSNCNEKIASDRLKALPYTSLCIECSSEN